MNHFELRDGVLHCEAVGLDTLAARFGTPLYVYSAATLRRHARIMRESVPDALVCFAVKANSTLAILRLFANEGLGFDVVSAGELARVVEAGGDPGKVVFSGVGKTRDDIAYALSLGIKSFNVESADELALISACATRPVSVALRVNPEVDAHTHPYIATGLRESKFGIAFKDAMTLVARPLANVSIDGLACHIGSQITSLDPFSQALDRLIELASQLRTIKRIDIGGGLGVSYNGETPPNPADYGALVRRKLQPLGVEILLEPGRLLVANAGVLLTRCIRLKTSNDRTYVIVDSGMNDLMRPALYQAFHAIEAVAPRQGTLTADIVGPVCESSDYFAKQRTITPVQAGDLLVLRGAGAYGFSMASNYNSRPRPAEVLVSGSTAQLIRKREEVSDLWRGEQQLDPAM